MEDQNQPNLHFLFADQSLQYDCQTCDKRCCAKGIDTELTIDRRIFAEFPELEMFTRPTYKHNLRILELPEPRCYFIREDGLCHIQAQHGHGGKPAMCRLYPTNIAFHLRRHGVTMIGVSLACPITPATGDGTIRHADVTNELVGAVNNQEFYPDFAPAHMDEYPDEFLDLEAFLRDLAAEFRGRDYLDFAAAQLAATSFFLAGADGPWHASEEELAEARASIAAHVSEVATLLGSKNGLEIPEQVFDGWRAVIGLLRVNLLMKLSNEAYESAILRAPYVLASLAWLTGQAAQVSTEIGGVSASFSLETLDLGSNRLTDMLVLLSHLDDSVELTAAPDCSRVSSQLAGRIEQFVSSDQGGQSVRDRLSLLADRPGDRVVALRALGEQCRRVGRYRPATVRATAAAGSSSHLRAVM